jgi:hypothetical protein
MSNGKSEELESIVHQFIDSDDLVSVIFDMININILAHNPNTPLEFINFKALKETIQHVVCMKNKYINKQFILDHADSIYSPLIWEYLILYRIIVDLEIFNKLSNFTKSGLCSRSHLPNLKVPKKVLMDYCRSYDLVYMARYPMTEDEIDYILSLYCDPEHACYLYDALAEYQYLTQRHLDIMKKRYLNPALRTIEEYY